MEEILQEIKLIKSRLDKIEFKISPPSCGYPVIDIPKVEPKPKPEPIKAYWVDEEDYELMKLFG